MYHSASGENEHAEYTPTEARVTLRVLASAAEPQRAAESEVIGAFDGERQTAEARTLGYLNG